MKSVLLDLFWCAWDWWSGLTCQTWVKGYLSVSGASWEHFGAALSKNRGVATNTLTYLKVGSQYDVTECKKKFVCDLINGRNRLLRQLVLQLCRYCVYSEPSLAEAM